MKWTIHETIINVEKIHTVLGKNTIEMHNQEIAKSRYLYLFTYVLVTVHDERTANIYNIQM